MSDARLAVSYVLAKMRAVCAKLGSTSKTMTASTNAPRAGSAMPSRISACSVQTRAEHATRPRSAPTASQPARIN